MVLLQWLKKIKDQIIHGFIILVGGLGFGFWLGQQSEKRRRDIERSRANQQAWQQKYQTEKQIDNLSGHDIDQQLRKKKWLRESK